jgi:hypothetical protein
MDSGDAPRKVDLVFFRNDVGSEPVREWLKGLNETERRLIGTDLLRARNGDGRLACPYAGQWVKVCEKCVPIFPAIAQHVF